MKITHDIKKRVYFTLNSYFIIYNYFNCLIYNYLIIFIYLNLLILNTTIIIIVNICTNQNISYMRV